MPRRSDASVRVGLCSIVRASRASKLSNDARPVDEGRDRLGLLGRDARRDVDEHDGPHELRRVLGEGQRRQPAERHADDGPGLGRQRADHLGHVGGVAGRRRASRCGPPSEWPWPGQVDGDQRPSEGHGDGVPRVGVLGAAVEEDQLGRAVAPHQRAEPAAGVDGRRTPAAPSAGRRRAGRTRRRCRRTGRTRRTARAHHHSPNWRAIPPSTRRHVPVIHAEASLAKNSAAPGKSSA